MRDDDHIVILVKTLCESVHRISVATVLDGFFYSKALITFSEIHSSATIKQ